MTRPIGYITNPLVRHSAERDPEALANAMRRSRTPPWSLLAGDLPILRAGEPGTSLLPAADPEPPPRPSGAGLPRDSGRPPRRGDPGRARGGRAVPGRPGLRGHGPALHRRARPRAGGGARHARHGEIPARLAPAPPLLRQLRRADASGPGGLPARLRGLRHPAFSAHRPGGDHAGRPRRQMPAGPPAALPPRGCIPASRASWSRARPSRTRCGARPSRRPASGSARCATSPPSPGRSRRHIMIGCIGEALTDEIDFDGEELEDARWFTKDDIRQHAGRAPTSISPPPSRSRSPTT